MNENDIKNVKKTWKQKKLNSAGNSMIDLDQMQSQKTVNTSIINL